MDIEQKLNITQSLRQEQVMTHQQIQALEFLSTPVLELQSMIDEELKKNPVLDVESPVSDTDQAKDDDEWLNKMLKLEEESRFIKSGSNFVTVDDDQQRQKYLESLETSKSLQDHLLEQLRFFDLDETLHQCCEAVISGLNDDGFLNSHPADLAMVCGTTIEPINEAIDVIRQMEPAGVGARDLRELLLIQLERNGREDSIAYTVVHDHLGEIANNNLPGVARKLNVSLQELGKILAEIKTLNPRLSHDDVKPHEYIKEEVELIEEEGKIEVRIVNDYLPNLYISQKYKQLLANPETPKDVQDYVKEKIRSGVHLINSIIQRQTTIQKTTKAIVVEQEDFFKFGMKHLKPMTMSRIAELVGVHETTISRAVAGKYLKCKYGLLPLRQFFSTGYTSRDGSSVSNLVVKKAIQQFIDEEDAYSPMSDSEVAAKLAEKGLKVARRTVAKYRESMGIFSSNLRRKYTEETPEK